jgi:hypothetical protein
MQRFTQRNIKEIPVGVLLRRHVMKAYRDRVDRLRLRHEQEDASPT